MENAFEPGQGCRPRTKQQSVWCGCDFNNWSECDQLRYLVYLQYGNPDSILFYRYWLLQSIVFIIHVCGQLPMVTRMKNHTDVLIFYMAVCAGAPQIAVMAEEKPYSLISLRTIAHGAPECGLR